MRENADSDRLIYVDPALDRRQSPTLNPFDLDTRDPFAIDVATQELVAVFAELLKGGAGFTLQMETLLKNCIATLLTKGGCGLSDLKDFMDDTANADLLAFADQNLSNPEQRDFLARDFRRDGYAQTKQSIRTRIQSLLNSEIFLNFLVGRSTFSLERGLRQHKLIVFNLASGKLGEDTTEAIGRFIIARLQTFAMRQGKLLPEWRVPVHLFVDECQYFLSPSTLKILTRTRTRKFKLYATLAQQFIGQETRSRDLIIALRGNTEIKITGRNTTHTLDILQKETATDLGELQRLQCGQFHVKVGARPSVRVSSPRRLLGDRHAMSEVAWTRVRRQQLQRYYAPTGNHDPQARRRPGSALSGVQAPKYPIQA